MDGTEQKVKSKYRTFCNLCRKRIESGEEVWSWTQHTFMIHLRCLDKTEAMSNYEFRTFSKKRSKNNQHPR
jgi:hypothetical protein